MLLPLSLHYKSDWCHSQRMFIGTYPTGYGEGIQVRGKGLKINVDNRCNPMAGYGRAQASVEQAQLVIRSKPGEGLEVSGDNWH